MAKHREYPIALKQAAVARVAAGESIAEVARDLKLRGRLLYAWRDKVRTGGPAALRERGRPRKGGMAVAAPAMAGGEGDLARAQRRGRARRHYSRRGVHAVTDDRNVSAGDRGERFRRPVAGIGGRPGGAPRRDGGAPL